MTKKTDSDKNKISTREKEVLTLLAEGYDNVQIAAKLNLSKRTVESHRAKIYLKLNVSNIAELVKYALKNQLTEL